MDNAEPWSEYEKQNIIEKFKWNIPQYIDYFVKKTWKDYCCISIWSFCFVPCFLFGICAKDNVTDLANAQFLAITRNEIIYCQKKVKTGCRCQCCDAGEVHKTIPFNRIQDLVLRAPAGGCCPQESLYTVEIQTAGAGGMNQAELVLQGLENAPLFIQKVKEQMKSANNTNQNVNTVQNNNQSLSSNQGQFNNNDQVVDLLKSINLKLEEGINLLKKQ